MSEENVEPVINGVTIIRRERANSYEFGKAGNRFKIYFEDVQDLQAKVKEIQDAGFGDEIEY